MSGKIDPGQSNFIQSVLWGTARGMIVETFIYPLEVIKIRQQCSPSSEKSIQVARRLLNQEGINAFYKGLAPQLLKTSLKQAWCWPMIIGIPDFFHAYGFSKTHQQVLTGLSIATVDAVISTPLERAKIFSAFTGQGSFSFTHIYKNGWNGFASYWAKRSINMSTFLVAQEYFRDNCHLQKERLSFLDLSKIGVKTALMVSMISAPFDLANTRKQAKNLSPLQLFSRQRIWRFYRGWPMNALSLIIHNIASVIIIEKLRPN